LRYEGENPEKEEKKELARIGRKLLDGPDEALDGLEVLGENMEKSSREVVILKPAAGYKAYGQMFHYYAVKNLMEYMESHPKANFASMSKELGGERVSEWVNLGGQLMPASDADQMRADIGSGKLNSWEQIHNRYNEIWEQYPLAKQRHAFAVLSAMAERPIPPAVDLDEKGIPYMKNSTVEKLDKDKWFAMLDEALEIQQYVCDQVYVTRKKDYENPFRQATYRNTAEMTAAIGTIEDNSFVKQVREETEEFKKKIDQIKKRG
jgi:hypothetical protein